MLTETELTNTALGLKGLPPRYWMSVPLVKDVFLGALVCPKAMCRPCSKYYSQSRNPELQLKCPDSVRAVLFSSKWYLHTS